MTMRFLGLTSAGNPVTVRVDCIIAFYYGPTPHGKWQTNVILKHTDNVLYVDETREEILQLITEIMAKE